MRISLLTLLVSLALIAGVRLELDQRQLVKHLYNTGTSFFSLSLPKKEKKKKKMLKRGKKRKKGKNTKRKKKGKKRRQKAKKKEEHLLSIHVHNN